MMPTSIDQKVVDGCDSMLSRHDLAQKCVLGWTLR